MTGRSSSGPGADIGTAGLVCCVRVPGEDDPGRRLREAQACPALARPVLGLAGHLGRPGVTRVVMEAAAGCWKPVLPAGGGRVRGPGW